MAEAQFVNASARTCARYTYNAIFLSRNQILARMNIHAFTVGQLYRPKVKANTERDRGKVKLQHRGTRSGELGERARRTYPLKFTLLLSGSCVHTKLHIALRLCRAPSRYLSPPLRYPLLFLSYFIAACGHLAQ